MPSFKKNRDTKKKKKNCGKKKKWFDKSCEEAKKEAESAIKNLRRYPKDPVVRGRYNKLKKQYKTLIRTKKRMFRESILMKIQNLESRDPKEFWKLVKDLRERKRNNLSDNIDPQTWYEWFKKLNQSEISDNDKTLSTIIKNMEDFAPKFSKTLDEYISIQEIKSAATKLKNNKSTCNDLISNEMIKCCVNTHFIKVIRLLFNLIIINLYYPKEWKLGLLIPIFKSDDSFDPSNYRGITVTSCLSKLFTLIMNERLVKYLNENSIMNHNQIGFRKNFRTSDHVFVLNTILNSYFSHNKPVYACFVDFSKAYDSVWRTALFYKLIVNQVSCRFIKLIQSMYSGLQSAVKLSYGITPFFESLIGVRQGCNLSPMLFNLFLNDLPEIFDSKCDPIRICNTELSCLLYADDLLILSETETGLRASINKLHSYAKSGNSVSILRKQKLWCSTKWVDITHYPFCLVTKLLIHV